MKKVKTIEQKKEENLERVLRDGPRLSYGMNSWIEAKTPCGNFVLLGGLGGMGCGTMWTVATELDRNTEEYQNSEIKPYLPADVFSTGTILGGFKDAGCECTICAPLVKAVRFEEIQRVMNWLQASIAKL